METYIQEMANENVLPEIPLFTSLSCCFMLLLLVVGGLFVYITEHNWDDNTTIQRRYISVCMVMLLSAFLIYSSPYIPKYLGNGLRGLWEVVPLSYASTSIILLGPILVNLQNVLHI
ncbi:CAAX prenyl protease 2-like [Drosophila serrata]|uniref:CAAX prenyl protease 2-like n=1 Tax=Drosophila serrata TaxID=7274 RepID=UPI000A1CFA53|nr:CAAX prenyl protease 2-like [Drosophila serrata]KAH8356875.1 hypothetical protein KR200_005040 [Drosophila serrata]